MHAAVVAMGHVCPRLTVILLALRELEVLADHVGDRVVIEVLEATVWFRRLFVGRYRRQRDARSHEARKQAS